jgi:hypothetical protein
VEFTPSIFVPAPLIPGIVSTSSVVYMHRKTAIYTGFGIICGLRHPLEELECVSCG